VAGNDDSPLPDTEVHYLHSDHVGDEFKILVGHCDSPDPASHVLYLGDAAYNFGTAVEIVRLLTLYADIPPVLVVSVGYRAPTLNSNEPLRSRDFTPSVDTSRATPVPYRFGGASRFVSFLRDELKPWVHERYHVDPDDSILFGFSLGGLFATYVLLNDPDMFGGYGIGSPSLLWDNFLMFDHEAQYARTHDDLHAKVHFSVGEYENTEGEMRWIDQHSPELRPAAEALADYEPFDLVGDAQRMVAQLRGRDYPSLEIDFEILPREYHHTAPPLALSRSLRFLLNAPS
jgi:predicted alpha/beta superfamily hydrolase